MCQGVLFLISVMSQAMAEIILALRRMIPTANSDSVLMSNREKKYLSSCHVAAKKKKTEEFLFIRVRDARPSSP